MKNIILLCVLMSLMLSCKSAAVKDSTTKPTATETNTEEDMTVYFKANGNEPFWALKMGREQTVFTSMISGMETLTFSSVEPIKAMDANVKMYKVSNEKVSAVITIQQLDCQDSMSGVVSPYSVKVEIKDKVLKGCGKYFTDYRLHDIWVLEELNGFKVFASDFQKEMPRIEIHATDNTFMGFGGCNTINGSIFYEKDLLRFTKVVSTRMACAPGNKENEFVKALQSTTTYSIGDNKLALSNPSGKLLVFRKVD